ncbi:hypothetical protein [Streptomyces sp. N35]|uniref:hypothetical protein n=1 Tax=Streptomyces sp. N35 TaxID=2795730 RepID=UPI0027DD0F36|nr:hypothetical protein [Streptomyces sp. N35]
MNVSPDPTAPDPDDASVDHVQVVLSECSVADADTVFNVLRAHFPSDRGAGTPRQTGDSAPKVWTGGFIAAHSPDRGPGVLLAGPVTTTLQGGPVAVARLREALDAAFVVTDLGAASGDQEIESQLRLTRPEHGAPPAEG